MIDGQSPAPDFLAELATLGLLARATGRGSTSGEVAAAALDILRRTTAADAGVVLFDDGDGFVIDADFGFPPGAVEGIVADRRIGDELAAALQQARQPLLAPIDHVPMRPEIRDALIAHGLRQVLIAPLRAGGQFVGLLGLGWSGQPPAEAAQIEILNASLIVGPSIENARLVARLQGNLTSERRLVNEEAALQSLTLIAESAGAFDELAATTVRQVVALLRATAGSYALVTEDDRLIHSASIGLEESFLDFAAGRPASSMASVRRLLDGSGPYLADYEPGAVDPHSLDVARDRGWCQFAMVPITVADRLQGLIALFFTERPEVPNPERTLGSISRIASISLANFRLRERLQASESRYRLLFEHSPDAILLLASDLELVDANRAALDLYRTDVAGLRWHFAHAGAGDRAERARRLELAQRDGHARFQGIGSRVDGSTFPEEVDIARMEIAGEARWLVLVRDQTEQHRLQTELLQAQKMEAIGQLVSGVAHELNNPLAAIVAFSQLIRADGRLPVDMRNDAELLVQEADRTRRIVANLLDFARQRPPERHPAAIRPLVDSVLALQSYSLAAGRIEVIVDFPDDLPLIEVDRSQLLQVLLNLTLNALQAIRSGRDSGHIWIAARCTGPFGSRVRLTVSDDGPGIPDELRSRLFLPFFTTKQPGQGTGLGLSVSFGIVASHGGTMQFEPRIEGGATFVVELPVGSGPTRSRRQRRTAPALPTAQPARQREQPRGRVLVLDDEPSIRVFLTRALDAAGFEVVTSDAGASAVDRSRTERFDAVLVDHRMPGMSGTEVYRAMIAIRPELAHRFIFMSGDVLNPELREFAASRGVRLLAKPFDVETVRALVADIVGDANEASAAAAPSAPSVPAALSAASSASSASSGAAAGGQARRSRG